MAAFGSAELCRLFILSSILVVTSSAPGGVYESADSAGDGTCGAARDRSHPGEGVTQAAAHRTRGADRRRGEAEGEAEGGRRKGRGVWASTV